MCVYVCMSKEKDGKIQVKLLILVTSGRQDKNIDRLNFFFVYFCNV